MVSGRREQTEQGGAQYRAQCQRSGDAEGGYQSGQELLMVALDTKTHGIVYAAAGYQREQGDDEIAGYRAPADPGHNLGVQGDGDGGQQIPENIVGRQEYADQVD